MISVSNDATGRLNAFQRLMLQWSELHPYNAAHIYKIARPSAPEELSHAIRNTYLAMGIGIVEVGDDGVSYRHQTDCAPEVTVVRGHENPDAMLNDHVTRELNRPFERPRCKPCRFSIVEAETGSHYLVVTYDHWIADSTAARMVVRHVLDRYCGWNRPENRRPLDLYPGTYREVFAHRLGGTRLLGAGFHALRQWMRNRSVAQVPYSSSGQMAIRFELHHTVSGTIPQLRHFARSLGATVHDVILAALGRAMAEHLPRRALRKRQTMALGTIVNARGEAQEDLSGSLGAFLGYYLVRLAADKDLSLAEATQRIAAATGPIKAQRAYLHSLLNMKLASAVWPYLRATQKRHFMRTVLPLTAGVSNVVVRDDWMGSSGSGCIAEYIRGASTGPILPLVLTPTTWGEEMNVGVSYRIAGFSRQKIDGVMAMFLDQIERPEGTPPSPRRRRSHRHAMSHGVVQHSTALIAAGSER
jgi:hypothetical protein